MQLNFQSLLVLIYSREGCSVSAHSPRGGGSEGGGHLYSNVFVPPSLPFSLVEPPPIQSNFIQSSFLSRCAYPPAPFIRADVKHGDWATQGRILNYSFFGSLFYGNLKLFSEIKESVDENWSIIIKLTIIRTVSLGSKKEKPRKNLTWLDMERQSSLNWSIFLFVPSTASFGEY